MFIIKLLILHIYKRNNEQPLIRKEELAETLDKE